MGLDKALFVQDTRHYQAENDTDRHHDTYRGRIERGYKDEQHQHQQQWGQRQAEVLETNTTARPPNSAGKICENAGARMGRRAAVSAG